MKTIEELFEVFDDLTPWDQEKVFELISKNFSEDYDLVLEGIPTDVIIEYLDKIGELEYIRSEEHDRGYDEGWLAAEDAIKDEED